MQRDFAEGTVPVPGKGMFVRPAAGRVCRRAGPSMPRRIAAVGVIAVAWAAAFAGWKAGAEPSISKEYKVKATYLFNFAQYVEWPSDAFADASTPLTIGVLGNDDFGPFLDQLAQGETIKNRPLRVKRSRQVEELKPCHLLFISKSEKANLAPTLAALGNASVLTVGETGGFALRGGVINFVAEEGRLRFEINLAEARRRGLKLNAQLLSLAKIVCESPAKANE